MHCVRLVRTCPAFRLPVVLGVSLTSMTKKMLKAAKLSSVLLVSIILTARYALKANYILATIMRSRKTRKYQLLVKVSYGGVHDTNAQRFLFILWQLMKCVFGARTIGLVDVCKHFKISDRLTLLIEKHDRRQYLNADAAQLSNKLHIATMQRM